LEHQSDLGFFRLCREVWEDHHRWGHRLAVPAASLRFHLCTVNSGRGRNSAGQDCHRPQISIFLVRPKLRRTSIALFQTKFGSALLKERRPPVRRLTHGRAVLGPLHCLLNHSGDFPSPNSLLPATSRAPLLEAVELVDHRGVFGFFRWPTISPLTVRGSTLVRRFSAPRGNNGVCGISHRCSAMNQIGLSVVIQLRSSNRARFTGREYRRKVRSNRKLK